MNLLLSIILKTTIIVFSLAAISSCESQKELNTRKSVGELDVCDSLTDLKNKAKKGDIDASFRLGVYYLRRAETISEAKKWLNAAADRKHPIALYNLSRVYIRERNIEKGINKLILAAKLNNLSSQLDLARFFLKGKHVEKDLEQAEYWYNLAAINGSALAQFELGEFYINKNKPKAYAWLMIAKDSLSSKNARLLSKIEKVNLELSTHLSESDINKARKIKASIREEIKRKVDPNVVRDSSQCISRS